MIPALLTCVFVIYLYQSLNSKAVADGPAAIELPPAGEGSASATFAELQERLVRLDQRLRALAEDAPPGGPGT